ncbi:UDP-N-acetylmuramate--L-alanine ligase [Candidatus Peregrinibacteria bacterium CG10_big_fil_rev_8_21_14_0_10_36_19]|nr:MAG: UDP-N-acetylmuramate--L-alanine ligase [Candidatus Peregrinibacteria bacterium CG10_big_fil_rev_8_21_14_0_10_36_19]
MKFTEAQKIHFVGIGGIGMSSIAQIIKSRGADISGSDSTPSDITKTLESFAVIFNKHSKENVPEDTDLVVYSPAVPSDNPEIIKAKEKNIPTISYSEALGHLSEEYFTIAIAGTHGKSTTTAMTSLSLESLDPTVVIGTKFNFFNNTNYRIGKSKYLIIEACEYKETFLHVSPNILIITNIEADHLDYFKNEENYVNAYRKLVKKLNKEDVLIINSNDKHSIDVSQDSKSKVIKWLKPNTNLKPQVPGEFNIENATFAYYAAKELNIENSEIIQQISKFQGTWRRMERKGAIFNTAEFIDDYAHHPTEIRATLKALREENPSSKILCIYQPHQHSRTKYFLEEFGKAFKDADQVLIPDIYKVRDEDSDVKEATTESLVNEISKHHKNVINGGGLKSTAEFIKNNHQNYDLIITMGAGNITDIYKQL